MIIICEFYIEEESGLWIPNKLTTAEELFQRSYDLGDPTAAHDLFCTLLEPNFWANRVGMKLGYIY